jgi:AcrR family transcriptional regulator
METPTKRKDIPPQRRAQILAAAAGLFSRGGYQGVTVDAIARRAGISKGNLYWYFSSKREIFQLLFDDIFERFGPPLQKIIESDEPPRQKLRALTRTLFEIAEANPEAMYLILQIAAQPELREMVSSEYSQLMRRYIDFVTPLFTAMGEKKPEDTAIVYVSILDALMALVVMGPDIYDRDRIVAVLEERFISFGREKDV